MGFLKKKDALAFLTIQAQRLIGKVPRFVMIETEDLSPFSITRFQDTNSF